MKEECMTVPVIMTDKGVKPLDDYTEAEMAEYKKWAERCWPVSYYVPDTVTDASIEWRCDCGWADCATCGRKNG